MILPTLRFLTTRHEARLNFDEPMESLLIRLRELSGARLLVGRGLFPWSYVTFDGDQLKLSEFGRRCVQGRVEPQPNGSVLVMSTSAPVRKAVLYLWWFTAACGLLAFGKTVLGGYASGEDAVMSFFLSSVIGSCLFPALWGRRWLFHRMVAALSTRLSAGNHSELQLACEAANLARRGAWTSALSTFAWIPLLAINGFPTLTGDSTTISAPWVNPGSFLAAALLIDLFWVPTFMLMLGWVFVGGGAASGYLSFKLLPNRLAPLRRWATTIAAAAVSFSVCWFLSSSKTLEQLFYLP